MLEAYQMNLELKIGQIPRQSTKTRLFIQIQGESKKIFEVSWFIFCWIHPIPLVQASRVQKERNPSDHHVKIPLPRFVTNQPFPLIDEVLYEILDNYSDLPFFGENDCCCCCARELLTTVYRKTREETRTGNTVSADPLRFHPLPIVEL